MVEKTVLIGAAMAVLLILLGAWYCWNEPIILNNGGVTKMSRGDFDGAIADFDAAINFEPKINSDYLKNSYFNRGLAKYKKGDLSGASSDLEMASRLAPGEPLILKTKGYVEYKTGNIQLGKEDVKKGLLIEWPTITPDDPSIEMNVQGEIERLDYSMNR